MSHTKTPWTMHKYPDCKTWTIAAEASVASKLTEANAAFIVKAVNSHAVLVEALETYGGHLGACAGGAYSAANPGYLKCDCGYDAALAIAKGQP